MVCSKCKSEIPDGLFCMICGKKQQKTKAPKALKRPNGSGTVYKLSGRRRKPWVAAINKIVIGYYSEKIEALSALESAAKVGISENYNITLADMYVGWSEQHYKKLSPKAIEASEIAWGRLEALGNRKFRDLRTQDFQKIIDTATTKGGAPLSYSGLQKIKQLCMHLSRKAMQEDILIKNYASFIQLPREEKGEKEILNATDIEKLKSDNSNTSKIILALIYSGFRINELFGLKLCDVNLEDMYFVGGEKTAAGKNRIVPIHKDIIPFVESWVSLGNDYLVANSKGGRMDAKNFRMRDYYPKLEELGIKKMPPHSTRHTFASMMVASGARPEVLQKIIGHASYSTTADIYVHQNIKQLKDAMDNLK